MPFVTDTSSPIEEETHRLIQACKEGDRAAWNVLVCRYQPAIYRYAYSLCRSQEQAEDIVSEVLLRLYQNLSCFREEAPFISWLFRIVQNCYLDLCIRSKHHSYLSLDTGRMGDHEGDGSYDIPDPAPSVETRAVLVWCAEDENGAETGLKLAGAMAWFWEVRGHPGEGRMHLERALRREGAQGSTTERARALNGAGMLAVTEGDYAVARTRYEESLGLRRQLGDKRGIAVTLNNLANVAGEQGDYSAAQTQLEESLRLHREIGDKSGIACSLLNLGALASHQGDHVAARTLFKEGLCLHRELGDKLGIANTLEKLVGTFTAQADESQATRLWGATAAIRQSLGAPLPPNEQEQYDQKIAQARSSLGEDAFTIAWEQGRAMTWEQAAAYALGET